VTQQEVAGDVAERVVDGSEIDQIEAQHRHHPIVPTRAAEHGLQPLDQNLPGGQPGERVMLRQGRRALLRQTWIPRILLAGGAPLGIGPCADHGDCRDRRAEESEDQARADRHAVLQLQDKPGQQSQPGRQTMEGEMNQEFGIQHARPPLAVSSTGAELGRDWLMNG
jgi:hypothetical protein